MGDKVRAKAIMAEADVPVLPSATVTDTTDLADAGAAVGFPLLVKAAFGGGGRGMRLIADPSELAEAVSSARHEAASAFGDGTVFLERFVTDPRHVEVQIVGDAHGDVVHLFERECSIQRRYQKIVALSPRPGPSTASPSRRLRASGSTPASTTARRSARTMTRCWPR
jgi:acetyl/propionyl-CoA carboxylase alpha subunit